MNYDWLFEDSNTLTEKVSLEEKSKDETFSVSEPIWTTSTGDKIPLSKMETRHILNSIKFLESKKMFKNKWFRILNDELTRRRTSQLKTSFAL